MSDDRPLRIEHVRADLADLAQQGAQEMLDAEELAAKKAERDGPVEAKTESYGVLISEKWDPHRKRPVYCGEVIGLLPGAKETTKVWAPTREGVFAMCHRAYLQVLTSNTGMDTARARQRAADAEFYTALVIT